MPTAITQFDEIYAVGDSMSDNGGIYQLSSDLLTLVAGAGIPTGGLQPVPPPLYEMRFSNGPVLPEITASLLGATLYDFAFGAAPALGSLTFGDLAQNVIPPDLLAAIQAVPGVQEILNHKISLTGQLADLTAALTANPPAENSALVSLIGLNDFQSLQASYDPEDPNSLGNVAALVQATIPGIIAANHTAAVTAFNLGIDTVIYETLPAVTFFPISNSLPDQLQTLGDLAVDAVNQGLVADALAFQQQGFDVRVVYTDRMADEISADPGTFGFLNFDVPWSFGNGIQFEPNLPDFALEQTAFFDPLHPTTNLHGVLGVFAAESLTSHTIFGDAGDNPIIGTAGDDLVLAGAGNDQVQLGAGNDVLFAGLGNDVANGGQDSDLMSGGSGNDALAGDNGSDVLAGNAGNDLMNGGNGDDALIDGLGSDTANGGNGNDVFLYTQAQILGGSGTDIDHFDGGAGFDTLALLLTPETLAIEQANVTANFVPGNTFTFSSVNLTVTGIEKIVLTTQFGFDDVALPGGELGARLHEADLFGFV
jgi:Ca2+-binding RTX toxin-like protein